MPKRKYISAEEPAKIRIVIGARYTVTDYNSQPLPGYVKPVRWEPSMSMYKCENDLGGQVWVKRGCFVAGLSSKPKPSTHWSLSYPKSVRPKPVPKSFCGQGKALTPDKTKVTCLKCKSLMKLHTAPA
jgi:hypothetical protein